MAGRWTRFDDVGKAVSNKVELAILKGGGKTLAQAAESARRNHPGWRNQTFKAERSIQVTEPMHKGSNGQFSGNFGSKGVDYFIWLEIGTRFHPGDHTLRRAADRTFPKVWDNIKEYL